MKKSLGKRDDLVDNAVGEKMMNMETIGWLLEGDPWVVYRTRLDLLKQDPDSLDVTTTYSEMMAHHKIQELLEDLSAWPGEPLKNHKKAGHLLHKLVFIADLGLSTEDPRVAAIVQKVLNFSAEEGPFQILVNLPKAFGGSGEDELSWMLCDAASTLYAVSMLDGVAHPRTIAAGDYLAGLVRETGGWPCAAAPGLGGFKGPGKREDPCPYANLLMVKALLPFGDRYVEAIDAGVRTLLGLWDRRSSQKPFLFAMGSGFAKLKAPLVWYDILHLMEVITQVPLARNLPAVVEMADIIHQKQDADGRYQPESIWMDWRGWDFGQKREPSSWLTFLVLRILQRIASSSSRPE